MNDYKKIAEQIVLDVLQSGQPAEYAVIAIESALIEAAKPVQVQYKDIEEKIKDYWKDALLMDDPKYCVNGIYEYFHSGFHAGFKTAQEMNAVRAWPSLEEFLGYCDSDFRSYEDAYDWLKEKLFGEKK